MKAYSAAALLTATVAVLALLGWTGKRRARQLQQIRTAVEQNLAETRLMHRHLRRMRGALHQIHQYIDPVPKGLKKAAS